MKDQLDNIIKRTNSLTSELAVLKVELVKFSSELKINEIQDDTKLIVKLKYDEFNFTNKESWLELKNLPEGILMMWYRYLVVNADISYSQPADNDMSDTAYKKLRAFSYDITHSIHNLVFGVTTSYYSINNLHSKYSQLTHQCRKEYVDIWLKKLDEIICLYENNK